ncbi:phytoene desaturase family protein [Orenia marismortui]|uniref:phytoene desaturase family protein n=1 Tax=Orenia marismortui TaxID=46469 RepID=UPI00036477DE|nr:phytoene desaturase family protein [Orenia marismortui]
MKVGIVGAGPGGLVAGLLLAKEGFQVTIYEQKDRVGGRNSSIQAEGYKFDIGPTFLMMPSLLEEIFAECGRDLHDYVDLELLNPHYKLFFGDGSSLCTSNNIEEMKESISKLSPSDAEGFDSYVKDNNNKISRTLPIFKRSYNNIFDLFAPENLKILPIIRPFTTLWDDLGNHFDDERIKIAFTFQSKYLGMSPYTCPSFFSILSFIEYKWGIYHVTGGINELSEAMAKLFLELGGKLELKSEVEEIKINDKKASELKLTNDKYKKFDEIVLNADFAYAMRKLIPNAKRRKYSDKNLDKKKYSCSTFMLYLGIDKIYDHLEHHNIFIANDYEKNLKEIEDLGILSEDPSFYIQNAAITDSTLAPEGHSTLYILVPTPNLKADIDWKENKEEFRDLIIALLKQRAGLEDIEEHIKYEKIITPLNWKEGLQVGYGACFNLTHSLDQMLIFRPHNKFEEFSNMWLVGGGTHPGSGLPTIYESGRIVAKEIAKKYNFAHYEQEGINLEVSK